MQAITRDFFEYVRTTAESDPSRKIDHRTWESCAVGDYVRYTLAGTDLEDQVYRDCEKKLRHALHEDAQPIYDQLNVGGCGDCIPTYQALHNAIDSWRSLHGV